MDFSNRNVKLVREKKHLYYYSECKDNEIVYCDRQIIWYKHILNISNLNTGDLIILKQN